MSENSSNVDHNLMVITRVVAVMCYFFHMAICEKRLLFLRRMLSDQYMLIPFCYRHRHNLLREKKKDTKLGYKYTIILFFYFYGEVSFVTKFLCTLNFWYCVLNARRFELSKSYTVLIYRSALFEIYAIVLHMVILS